MSFTIAAWTIAVEVVANDDIPSAFPPPRNAATHAAPMQVKTMAAVQPIAPKKGAYTGQKSATGTVAMLGSVWLRVSVGIASAHVGAQPSCAALHGHACSCTHGIRDGQRRGCGSVLSVEWGCHTYLNSRWIKWEGME